MFKRQDSSDHSTISLLIVVTLFVLVLTPFSGGFSAWTEEDGAIEIMSLVIWILCPLVFVLEGEWPRWIRYPHVVAMTLLLGEREAPFDAWIVDERLLQTEFYAMHGFSLTAVAGGAIALFVLVSLVTFFIFGIPAAWRAHKAGKSWPAILCVGVGFAAAAQAIEEWLMEPMAALTGSWLPQVAEEGFELIFVVLVLAAILLASGTSRSTSTAAQRRVAISD